MFNPCVVGDAIYLCSGCASSVQVYFPLKKEYQTVEVLNPEKSSCIAFAQGSSSCVVITRSTCNRLTRETWRNAWRLSSDENRHAEYMAWSGCSPLVLGEEVFLMDVEYWMARWVNAKTGEKIGEKKFS